MRRAAGRSGFGDDDDVGDAAVYTVIDVSATRLPASDDDATLEPRNPMQIRNVVCVSVCVVHRGLERVLRQFRCKKRRNLSRKYVGTKRSEQTDKTNQNIVGAADERADERAAHSIACASRRSSSVFTELLPSANRLSNV